MQLQKFREIRILKKTASAGSSITLLNILLFSYSGRGINMRASELAKKVADEGGALTLGGICQCPTYLSNVGKEAVQEEFRKQIQVFVEAGLDFLLCEVYC